VQGNGSKVREKKENQLWQNNRAQEALDLGGMAASRFLLG